MAERSRVKINKRPGQKCQVEFQQEAPPGPLPLVYTPPSLLHTQTHTHTELPMLSGCCVRSSSLPAKPREPCPRRLTQSPASPANLCPLFPHSANIMHHCHPPPPRPRIHPAIRLAKTPRGCLRVRAACPHPSQPIRFLVSRL